MPTRGGGGSNNTTSSSHFSSSKQKGWEAAVAQLSFWMQEAEYEINVDAYRGMQPLLRSYEQQQEETTIEGETATTDATLERKKSACEEEVESSTLPGAEALQRFETTAARSSTNHHNNDNDDESSIDLEGLKKKPKDDWGPWIAQCTPLDLHNNNTRPFCRLSPSCPSSNKKSSNQQTSCDYNPFCLASGELLSLLQNSSNKETSTTTTTTTNSSTTLLLSDDDDDDVQELSYYSSATRELLQQTRRSERMSRSTVERHWQELWVDNAQAFQSATERGLDCVEQSHELLVFHQPKTATTTKTEPPKQKEPSSSLVFSDDDEELKEVQNPKKRRKKNSPPAGSMISIATPPGMENLGATCYLNTQLQCLAQNVVFVKGILSWQPQTPHNNGSTDDDDDRMRAVLSLFQSLLARMRYGGFNTVNTLEFSNALGLDHYEQQDPNEFSGLLLEKMHQAFAKEENSNLKDLIPNQFQGSCSFQTTCQHCQSTSGPTEHFMDLKLPIEQRPSNNTISVLANTLFSKKKDVTDLEYLFERYCAEESLVEETVWYECQHCQTKRPAVRKLVLKTLPSLLNVQLVRYVWTKKGVKKKVGTAVRLPRVLTLPQEKDKNGNPQQRYRLCAIMSHQGNSAYQGHYVAEAMDWMTGQWYQFNDMQVRLLKEGPPSQYDSNERNSCKGSTDAYNLYYVEERFLAQSVLEASTSATCTITNPFVQTVQKERFEHYAQLANMCVEDGKAAQRLARRRSFIIEKMVPLWPPTDWRHAVWVDNSLWLRFLSCTDRLEADLLSSPLLRHKKHACAHGKLHPRTARRGKLLPRNLYDLYVQALQDEQQLLHGPDAPTSTHGLEEVTDILIAPDQENLFCDICTAEYRQTIQTTLSTMETVKSLYYLLSKNQVLSKLEPDLDETWGNACDTHLYIVERKFITRFRTVYEKEIRRQQSSTEGLSGLTVDKFLLAEDSEDAVFRTVNSNIACKHGRLTNPIRKTRYFYVRGSTWRLIQRLFPNAIELKEKRPWGVPVVPEKEVAEDANGNEVAELGQDEAKEDASGQNGKKDNGPDGKKPLSGCPICEAEATLDEPELSDPDISGKAVSCEQNVITLDDSGNESCTEKEQQFVELRVFEIVEGAQEHEIQSALASCCNSAVHVADESAGTVRRSSRKRKLRLPVGVIHDEVTLRANLSKNIAALRLLLVQECPGMAFEVHHKLQLAISVRKKKDYFDVLTAKATTGPFELVDLPFEKNNNKLGELCETEMGQSFGFEFDAAESVVLLRQFATEDLLDMPKEELWDHLISVANVDDISGENDEQSRKRRRTERGFTGTFLSSAAPTKSNAESSTDAKPVEEESDEMIVESSNVKDVTALQSKPPAKEVLLTNHPAKRQLPVVNEDDLVPLPESESPVVDVSPPLAATSGSPSSIESSAVVTIAPIVEKKVEFVGETVGVSIANETMEDDDDEDDNYLDNLCSGVGLRPSARKLLDMLKSNPDIQPFNLDMGSVAVEQALEAASTETDAKKVLHIAYSYYLNLTQG